MARTWTRAPSAVAAATLDRPQAVRAVQSGALLDWPGAAPITTKESNMMDLGTLKWERARSGIPASQRRPLAPGVDPLQAWIADLSEAYRGRQSSIRALGEVTPEAARPDDDR
jgi:hypothetical protein